MKGARDGDGERVAKGTIAAWSCDPSTNGFQLTQSYVRSAGGESLTVMGPNGTPLYQNVSGAGRLLVAYDSQGTHYQVTDPLGTRRLQTDAAGVPEMDFEELPYGDGLTAIPDPNDMDESDDATPFHFTGKERDLETGFANGNDYFDARYYASSMGRFLSPDPLGQWVADVSDPQSWNLYTYARNNPLINVDPTGFDCVYFNDAGTGLDTTPNADGTVNPVDRNSTPKECQGTGGDWVNGRFTGMTPDDNNDSFTLRSVDATGTNDVTATAPGPQSNGQYCGADCESTYKHTYFPGLVPEQDIAPSAQVFIDTVAAQTAPVNKAFDCAGAASVAFSPYVTPDAANNPGEAATDQGVDAAEEGLDRLSEVKALSRGARGAAKIGGKLAKVTGTVLAVHSAYENMKEAGCFGGEPHP